jgi:CheY-like chemotaxis protein
VAEQVDLAILDVAMPRLTGLQAAELLAWRRPATRVLILSMYDNDQYLLAALRVGALGYLLKSVADEEVVEACRAVLRGERFLRSPVASASARREFEVPLPGSVGRLAWDDLGEAPPAFDACRRDADGFFHHIRSGLRIRSARSERAPGQVEGHVYGRDGSLVALALRRGLFKRETVELPLSAVEWILPRGRQVIVTDEPER